ncbi:9102_t:CDS:2 [Funneliformis geosporum]|nr:9102_t:CDS:2 [Funneliformis geosporum]
MAKAFARGVYFYEDLEKDFPNPDLGLEAVPNGRLAPLIGPDIYTAQALVDPGEPTTVPVSRPKGTMYPQGDIAKDLPKGHTHGAFDLHFDKPVKKMVDIYSCIGCGAHSVSHKSYGQTTPGFVDLHSAYDSGATQERPDGKPFIKAHGYIPNSSTITWDLTDEGSAKIKLQKVPGHDDFDKMDWTPPPGSGGDTDIPFTDPDVGVDPTKDPDGPMPEPDFVPDIDPGGPGEPEITPLEPDITIDPDFPDDEPDFTEPEIPEPEITPPEPDP